MYEVECNEQYLFYEKIFFRITFRKVLEIKRHSTSMISNDTQSQSEHSLSQYY